MGMAESQAGEWPLAREKAACNHKEATTASERAYLFLSDCLPFVDEATDTLGALPLLGCQLPQPYRGFWLLTLLGLCFLSLQELYIP